ncbi:hypothetical protein ABZV34_36445 [Streptomyces sp. NPDC005195]
MTKAPLPAGIPRHRGLSGFGREFGIHGLNAYLETRTVFAG